MPVTRSLQFDPPGVEEEPTRSVRTPLGGSGAVDRIARYRVIYGGQVDPDLVRSAGDQIQFQQRPAGQPLPDPISGDRLATARHHRHTSSVVRIAPDRRLDAADVGRDGSLDQGQVGLLDLPGLELGHETRLGLVVLGHHQQAARVAVQTVDDTRAQDAVDAAVVGPAGQECVDKRAARMAGGRVDNETGRLVDDEHVVVFVGYRERDFLGLHLERDRVRDIEIDGLAGHDLLIRLDRKSSDGDLTVNDQLLNVAPGQSGSVGDKTIHSASGSLGHDDRLSPHGLASLLVG